MNLKRTLAGLTLAVFGAISGANASTLIGGNVGGVIGDADSVLDIVFAIDTSGSMSDDASAISNAAEAVIDSLNCDSDVYVRARFFGITGTWGGTRFDESLDAFLSGPTINSSEDNGPAVTDTVNLYPWFSGLATVSGQNLYKAVVTIGDEGTENGEPVNQADWDAAVVANSTAIANDVFLFSWASDDPWDARVPYLYQSMSEGGDGSVQGFTGVCADTGGAYVQGTDSADVEATLESIICTAATGGTGAQVPVPDTLLLLGLGVLGLSLRRLQA